MSIRSHVVRQTDFSAGQLAETAMRAGDKPIVRAACRRIENFRILSTGPAEVRPGRRALFLQEGRTDEVRMSPTATFKLCFGDGTLIMRNSSDAVIKTASGYPWDKTNVDQIVWARVKNQIVVWFPGMRPVVAAWDGATTWVYSNFAFLEDGQGKRYEPYYRFASGGIKMAVSALTGASISVAVVGEDVFQAGHVGTRFRYGGRQLEITAVTDARNATANVIENLPPTYDLAGMTVTGFSVGDAVEGATSGAKGLVHAIVGTTISVHMTKGFSGFSSGEIVVGPYGRSAFSSQTIVSPPSNAPNAIWDEAACSTVRGWPQSGFSDQDRLGMCDLPSVPNGVMWSAINSPTDMLPGSDPDSGMFETLNSPDRVYHVVGGADEFVFSDRGVKYIPISESNPLKPGSVAFRDIPSAPSSSVRPLSTSEGVLYVDAGRGRLVGVVPTGQVSQPYITKDVSEYHAALFKTPVALAGTTGDSMLPERYVYVLNSDGTLAVGRFDAAKEWVGWVPWSGPGNVKWISGLDNRLHLTSLLTPNEVDRYLVALQDQSAYLDALVPINAVPTQLAPGVGQGPLWWLASSEVHLLDGRRYLGMRQVDEDGNIVAEEGEDLSGADIVAGLNAEAVLEPFIHHAPEGQSARQSMRRRKIKRISVVVQNSLGFLLGKRRIPPWLQGEDQAGQPPLRERAYFFRQSGRAIDPRVALTKDIPGPLRVVEIGYEVTV